MVFNVMYNNFDFYLMVKGSDRKIEERVRLYLDVRSIIFMVELDCIEGW